MSDDKSCLKKPFEEEEEDEKEKKYTKAKRHGVEVSIADVDIKLAEKLDNVLKVSFNSRKPKFLTNKLKDKNDMSTSLHKSNEEQQAKLIQKDFTKEQLKQRLLTKYETLVPELDPNRARVRLVKILSASESIELGKDQARKQMERQLELSSISKNQEAFKNQYRKFKFNDGYEQPSTNNKQAGTSNRRHASGKRLVRFVDEPSDDDDDDVTDEDDYDEANEDFIDVGLETK